MNSIHYPTVSRDQETARRRYQRARDKANQLGLYVFVNDATDWVIASSLADADAVSVEQSGSPIEPGCELDWKRLPHDRVLVLHMDDGRGRVEQTCAEWIAEQGRSFLGSTNY